jgi:lysylphosphatidylglycerol synthetase-like protein (DUF2156 family)
MGLLLLARNLQQRLDAAYVLTIVLLCVGIVGSLLKGFDYEEALVLGLILVVMLPSHSYFYRKSSLFSQGLSPGWIAAVLIVLICTAWLGFYTYLIQPDELIIYTGTLQPRLIRIWANMQLGLEENFTPACSSLSSTTMST